MPSILWAMALELAIVAGDLAQLSRQGEPFLVAGGFIVAQMLTMGLMADNRAAEVAAGHARPGAERGRGADRLRHRRGDRWAGWQAGKRPAVPVAGAAQAA